MTSSSHRSSLRDHPIATGFGWLFAVASTALSVLVLWMTLSMIGAWSSYEGGESQVALAITGFAVLVTLLSWGITWILLSIGRNRAA